MTYNICDFLKIQIVEYKINLLNKERECERKYKSDPLKAKPKQREEKLISSWYCYLNWLMAKHITEEIQHGIPAVPRNPLPTHTFIERVQGFSLKRIWFCNRGGYMWECSHHVGWWKIQCKGWGSDQLFTGTGSLTERVLSTL